ncbi:RNA replication protein [Eumeta japonica]|uniref:RNA replication protein n=1 Tax=Eumeta variegata TaxID=151549 RepID=A0A4C1YX86_EUMVA|nr:RNA replication protein [Eumeta japonica]
MYEDRGENLSFLHKYDPACSTTPIDSWGHPVKDPEEMSGSERLRKQIKLKRRQNREAKELAREQRSETGEVKPPVVMPVENPKDHMRNAFLEFAALTIAIQDISTNRQRKPQTRPNTKLRKRSNSGNDQRHKGSLGRKNPENDEKLSKENDQDYSETFTDWETPKITWINGVPGCGKTTWIVQEFDKRDCIVTATIEAAEDLKRKLANRIGAEATTRVRTMASVLVNGFKEHTHNRLLIDEAMMNHFGAIITAALLAKAKELLLIGDINQIPHIDRHNVFPMSYEKPNAVAKVSRELLRSYRNPMDVAYALNEIYSGIYSTQEGTRSLTLDGYDRNKLSISLPQTLYLAHTSWQNRAKSHGMRTSDAIGRLIQRANNATSERIIEYNAKMAIRSRDINSVREITKYRRKPEQY